MITLVCLLSAGLIWHHVKRRHRRETLAANRAALLEEILR